VKTSQTYKQNARNHSDELPNQLFEFYCPKKILENEPIFPSSSIVQSPHNHEIMKILVPNELLKEMIFETHGLNEPATFNKMSFTGTFHCP